MFLELPKQRMEKIPAACAMEWSIQLEKCLRSKIPGKAIEGILEIGARLEWWNSEPNLTMAEYKMFGLIPGEDKLFLNAIFLRLADAFRLGDKQTKICIVKIFLALQKSSRKTGGDEGILCKDKLENYKELLRRVEIVFDGGDVEERALALGLFGCWANIAKDSAHIRYLLLSSLVSSDVLEVKASLFAGRCFCEMADDFASVFLEILVNILISCETTGSVRLAAARAFAKLWHPFLLADRTYKTGLKLALDSPEEDFAAVMLISLSKVASNWSLLIPRQIEITFSFLIKKTPVKLQLAALGCLHITLATGICRSTLSSEVIQNLLNIIDESKYPLVLRCKALNVMCRILLHPLPAAPDMEDVVSKLFSGVKDIIQHSVMSMRLFAFRVLVDVSKTLPRIPEAASDGRVSALTSQLISFVMDRILLLVESNMNAHKSDTGLELEFKSLLDLLFNLVKENSNLAALMLDKICELAENLARLPEKNESKLKADLLNPDDTEFGMETEISFLSKTMLRLSKLVIACLEDLPNEVSTKVLNVLKLLVENICRCSSFDVNAHTIYFLLLHSFNMYSCMLHDIEKVIDFNGISRLPRDDPLSCDSYILEHEVLAEYARRVVGRKHNWSSYKVGKFAARRGVWSAAACIFEQLMTMVQSDYCIYWLKTLAQISHSERQIELLGCQHLKGNLSDKEDGVACKIHLHNSVETLHEACNIYLLSEQTLAASSTGLVFCFQRWLLTLRAKVLGTVTNVINLICTNSCAPDNTSENGQVERNKSLWSLVYPFTRVSNQFKNLALEFDLLATSFIGMDRNSMVIILVLALSCSLLAFCTGFAFFIPNSHALESIDIHNSEEPLYPLLIQDLVGRLWHLDCATCTNLRKLLKVLRGPKSFSLPRSRKQFAGTCYEAKGIVKLCQYAATEILGLQHKADKVQDNEGAFQIYKEGLQFLHNIISIWVRIPFQVPSHFFQVRPCLSCELYVMNEEGTNVDGLSFASGCSLPLNLCLQLRNIPPNLPDQLIKLYCILCCTRSLDVPAPVGENKWQSQLSIGDWGAEDMVDLQVKLLECVTGSNNLSSMRSTICGGDSNGVIDEFVCFRPNKRGQGFSTCLLDISTFPAGSYTIKWLSCCIDSTDSYWNLLPLNAGPVFSIQQPHS